MNFLICIQFFQLTVASVAYQREATTSYVGNGWLSNFARRQ